jgi:hypothetical protein
VTPTDGEQRGAGDAPDDLGAAAATLYGVAPAEFVATRKALAVAAKSAADPQAGQEIAALRKPSVGAWAVNHVFRRRPELLEQLLELGERLRSAQTRLDAAALRDLRADRDALLAQIQQAAVAEAATAGQNLTATVQAEVRDTMVAALASADAAHAVATGTLTRALTYSGFGEVDIADAVARTSTGVTLAVIRGTGGGVARGEVAGGGAAGGAERGVEVESAGERSDEQREAVLRYAQLAVARSQRVLDAASKRLTTARDASEKTRDRVATLRAQLAEAEAEDEQLLTEVSDAVQARTAAQAAHEAAQGTLAELTQDGG